MGQQTHVGARPDAAEALKPAFAGVFALACVALVVGVLPVPSSILTPSLGQTLWTLAACATSYSSIRWTPLRSQPALAILVSSLAIGVAFAAPCVTDPKATLHLLYFLPFLGVPVALQIPHRLMVGVAISLGVGLLAYQVGQPLQLYPLLGAFVCSAVWGLRLRPADQAPAPDDNELSELQRVAERLVRNREEERRRLARELHDGTGQLVHGLRLELDFAQLQAGESESMNEVFVRMSGLLDQLSQSVREILADLGPAILDDVGPVAAIEALARQHEKATDVTILTDLDSSLQVTDRVIALTVYRIAQEALTNALRHSGAGTIRVIFRSEGALTDSSPRSLVLIIADDGQGIDTASSHGYGLANMRERAALVGALLSIDSSKGGTTVRLRTPLSFRAAAISSTMNVAAKA